MIVRQKKKEIGVSILPIYFEKVTGDYYMRKLRKVIAMALMSAVVIVELLLLTMMLKQLQ